MSSSARRAPARSIPTYGYYEVAPRIAELLVGSSTSSTNAADVDFVAGAAAPEDVAKFLLQLALSESEPDPLTHLRLQKLMYYVQGWSLAIRGRPAFVGRIEAWAHGPVVKELYDLLKGAGDQLISARVFNGAPRLANDDAEFVGSVWDAYKRLSATALREMTQKDTPWRKARGAAGPADRCETEIKHEDLRAFFSKQLN